MVGVFIQGNLGIGWQQTAFIALLLLLYVARLPT
jgi:hypothetical protein